ncbi:MAG: helix-turn-helix domain-containing protein [Candidatus Poseidoniaceae archaeon]|nr:helix-turn-helix domain-containing protein [Candidatus Poseidoniaceae archaeon]
MRVDGLGFDLPNLTSNPFSAIPLEGSKSDLYVGRLDIRRRLAQHIKFRSTRRILMAGDLGSGRTSLLRCSALEAPVSVHIDHISASNPLESILQRMYSELVGYDFPSNTVELVKKMVDFSHTFSGSLPLIVIDTPNVEDSVLYVALRDVLPALERLQAVIVVVVESKQRMNIPESVLHSFDNVETLSILSVDEVQALVEKRISSVSDEDFSLDFENAQAIHSKTGGLPLEVVKFMRDAIDNYRMNDSVSNQQYKPLVSQNDAVEIQVQEPELQNNQDLIEGNDSEIIDASVPWNERDSENKSSTFQAPTNLFDFDLDLDGLSESQQSDKPVEDLAYSANPDTEEIIIADSKPRPTINAGAFGGLLGRTRDFEEMEKNEPEEMVNQHNNHGTELWVSKEMIEAEEKVEFEEHNSAELIYDEIGLEDDEDELNTPALDEFSSIPESQDDSLAIQKIMSLLSNLVSQSSQQKAQPSDNFLDSLLNFSQKRFGEKIDYPLNPTVLSSLNSSESYVLSIAKVRKYSPSDKEILEHLGIKRPRLSQISNKLLKSGILNARMKGRSRYYELTQSAKAQLIAWGIIGGDE